MTEGLLVLNAGSSSIKFALFNAGPSDPVLLCKGLLDEHEARPHLVVADAAGKDMPVSRPGTDDEGGGDMLAAILAVIGEHFADVRLAAVGHRIVHGGPDYHAATELTPDVCNRLAALTPLAPLHQPRCLAPVAAIRRLRPALRQVGCFDTAFHHGLTSPANRLALPRRFDRKGLRRYGFHGLSFAHVSGRLADLAPRLAASRIVIAHLGNGASLCALRDGRSVDTTMGVTPLDGLVMGTRCGAIDPGLVLQLMTQGGMSAAQVEHLLYRESGLLGVSGISADMRTLLASREPAAREAIDLFTFRVAQHTAMMAASLGGLDGLVFTGGIGEHAAKIRADIGERLAWLGVAIDATANERHAARISLPDSRVETWVIPTDEELTIARQCAGFARPAATFETPGRLITRD